MSKHPNSDISVLLIEDDPMVQEVNRMFIEKVGGYSVIGSASNGYEGRSKIEESHPDLVLLDVFMPKEDGLECVRLLREAKLDVDIITVTAAKHTETIQEFLRAGVIDYIVKPFTFERLQTALIQYQQRYYQLSNHSEMSQEELDKMMLSGEKAENKETLPKGMQAKTLQQVTEHMDTLIEPKPADEIGQAVGLARVTVSRYLNYLESIGKVKMKLTYGQIGRPVQLYQLLYHSKGSSVT